MTIKQQLANYSSECKLHAKNLPTKKVSLKILDISFFACILGKRIYLSQNLTGNFVAVIGEDGFTVLYAEIYQHAEHLHNLFMAAWLQLTGSQFVKAEEERLPDVCFF